MEESNNQDCQDCFKIICRGCGWEPDVRELALIQAEILTNCPICHWSPPANPQKIVHLRKYL